MKITSRKRVVHLVAPKQLQNPLTPMKRFTFFATISLAFSAISLLPSSGRAASAAELDQSAKAALRSLYASNPAAQAVGKKAKAILVFQAGVQKFSYAMFFMNDASKNYLRKSGGWEVGSAPSLVVVDTGMARSLSTTTLKKGIYVFFLDQKGLMGGLGLQGTKITQYTPSA